MIKQNKLAESNQLYYIIIRVGDDLELSIYVIHALLTIIYSSFVLTVTYMIKFEFK